MYDVWCMMYDDIDNDGDDEAEEKEGVWWF